jgi:hypothetical protein
MAAHYSPAKREEASAKRTGCDRMDRSASGRRCRSGRGQNFSHVRDVTEGRAADVNGASLDCATDCPTISVRTRHRKEM